MTTQERIEAALSGKPSEPILYCCEGCGEDVPFGETEWWVSGSGEAALIHDTLGACLCGPVVEILSSAEVQTGDVIETIGWGRTAKWGTIRGKVQDVRDGSVFVVWDGGFIEDEMDPREVRRVS